MIRLIDIYRTDARIEAFLWKLMAERLEEGDTNISHVKMPTPQEHHDFILSRHYRGWYVIETQTGELAGAVSISNNNELGIVVSKQFRQHGYAKAALQAIMEKHPALDAKPAARNPHYVANIRDGNTASTALFESLGFKILQHTYTL